MSASSIKSILEEEGSLTALHLAGVPLLEAVPSISGQDLNIQWILSIPSLYNTATLLLQPKLRTAWIDQTHLLP